MSDYERVGGADREGRSDERLPVDLDGSRM